MTKEQSKKSIPANERVPTREKAAFALGGTMDYFATGMLTTILWMPFFNLGLGMNAAVLGGILMVFRLWDAFTDPFCGNLSDNARTRWGRRRPFMFAAAITTGCLFPLFWYMPGWLGDFGEQVLFTLAGSEITGLALCLTILGMIFFASFSFWSMPYYGLQLELTPNYDERTRVAAWMSAVSNIAVLMGGVVLWAVNSDLFADPVTGNPDIVKGVKMIAIPFAGLIIIAGLLPALFVKERFYEKEAAAQESESFATSIKESFQCAPLWMLIGISFFVVFGSSIVDGLGFYVNIFKVSGGDMGDAGYIEFLKKIGMVVSALATIPLWTWLAGKWDKKIVVGITLVAGVVAVFLNYLCLRPDMPYLQIIPSMFIAGAVSSVWLILPSMKADVADYDELRTGKRREGSLNAFYSWFIKAALTASAGMIGIIIQFIAKIDPSLDVQPEAVINRLFWAYLLLPGVLLILPMFFLVIYPLSRKKMDEIRAELELRRGEL